MLTILMCGSFNIYAIINYSSLLSNFLLLWLIHYFQPIIFYLFNTLCNIAMVDKEDVKLLLIT